MLPFNADTTKDLKKYSLTENHLKRECSDKDLLDIDKHISWDIVGHHLPGIKQKHIDDINLDMSDQSQKRQRLVDLWKERNGSDATFGSMITAMLKAEKRNEAEKVCRLLSALGKSE